jgi:hypothetical protein
MRFWNDLKTWKKGAILGAIWPIIVGFIPFPEIKSLYFIGIIIQLPGYIAGKLGFHWYSAFVVSPLIGALIGGVIGFLYQEVKESWG